MTRATEGLMHFFNRIAALGAGLAMFMAVPV